MSEEDESEHTAHEVRWSQAREDADSLRQEARGDLARDETAKALATPGEPISEAAKQAAENALNYIAHTKTEDLCDETIEQHRPAFERIIHRAITTENAEQTHINAILSQSVAEQARRIAELEGERDEANARASRKDSAFYGIIEQRDELASINATLRNQVAELTRERDEAKRYANRLRGAINGSGPRNVDHMLTLENEVATLRETIANMPTERDTLRTALAEAQAARSEAAADTERIRHMSNWLKSGISIDEMWRRSTSTDDLRSIIDRAARHAGTTEPLGEQACEASGSGPTNNPA